MKKRFTEEQIVKILKEAERADTPMKSRWHRSYEYKLHKILFK